MQISFDRLSSIAVLGLALVSLVAPLDANAQTSASQWAQCLNRDNAYARDLQIGGCTAVIRSGQETPDKLALAFGQRGRAYSAQKEYANAIADFDQAGKLAPNYSVWQNDRCWWRAVANRELDVARAACDAALSLSPKSAGTLDSRGLVGLRQGRFLDAWDDYDGATSLSPNSPTSLFGRGVALLGLGRSQEGQADIARATQLDSRIAQTYASYGVTPVLRAPTVSAVQAVSTFRDCSDCPEMVSIPAGSFMMGSPATEVDREDSEGPQRRVTVPAFSAGKYEVTWNQYNACVTAGGCSKPEAYRVGGDPRPVTGSGYRPVTNVSWNNAVEYTKWLSNKTGKTYRLLSEAEWEYAARAGSSGRWSFGEDKDLLGNYAWYSSNSGTATHAVGTKTANAFGLHDMHGNVREWVQDCGVDNYSAGQPSNGSAFQGGECFDRVTRGGSLFSNPRGLRSANRVVLSPSSQNGDDGFRVARTLSSTAPVASPAAAQAFGPYNPGNLVDESDPYRTILSGSCKTLTVTTSLSVRRMPLRDVIDMTALPNGDGSARVTSNCRDGRACVTIETPEEKLEPQPDLSVQFIESGLADEYVGKVDMLKKACGLAR